MNLKRYQTGQKMGEAQQCGVPSIMYDSLIEQKLRTLQQTRLRQLLFG